MKERKCVRYIADCGRGFWSKDSCLTHEQNCKCWTNPKHKTCKTCAFGYKTPAEYDVGELGGFWECNNQENNDEHSGAPDGIDYLSVNCKFWESIKSPKDD